MIFAVPAFPQLYNLYLCPVLMLSIWLLLCRPFIEVAFQDALAELRKDAASADKDELIILALHSIYLFPKLDKNGRPIFRSRMEKSAADDLLRNLRVAAGFAARWFSWHGVVSWDVTRPDVRAHTFLVSCRAVTLSPMWG